MSESDEMNDLGDRSRREKEREEQEAMWERREGLITYGTLPMEQALGAFLNSIPRMTEVMPLVEGVLAGLGERAWFEVNAGADNKMVYLRAKDDPRFLLHPAFLFVDVNVTPSQPIHMPAPELPAALRAEIEANKAAALPAEPEPEPPPMLPGPIRVPGTLKLAAGPSHLEVKYGLDGNRDSSCSSATDNHTFVRHYKDRPYTVDPESKPRTPPPLPVLFHPDLNPNGHSVSQLTGMVLEMAEGLNTPGRLYVPVDHPGGADGCWTRGIWGLREASWQGRLGSEEEGWVVMDAWAGAVFVLGSTLEEAFTAWREAIQRAQPLPPLPPPLKPLDPIEPVEPSSSYDEEKKITRVSTGTLQFTLIPRVHVEWPEPRPENVPAVALPLPPLLPIPDAWYQAGFTRRVRLIGDSGKVGSALVMEEGPKGMTLVGEGAMPALDPANLASELDKAEEKYRGELEEMGFPFGTNPYQDPQYTCRISTYNAWTNAWRKPELNGQGVSWGDGFSSRGLDTDSMEFKVLRLRWQHF